MMMMNIIPLMKNACKLQSIYAGNVFTDPLATGRGSLGIRAAHLGNY